MDTGAVAHLLVIDLARKCDTNGRRDHLLHQTRHFALVVDLSPERRLSEVVLGTNANIALLLRPTHGTIGSDSSKSEVAVDSRLDFVGQPAPVRSLQHTTIRNDLPASHPVGSLVSRRV
jgi:hypothetical protein